MVLLGPNHGFDHRSALDTAVDLGPLGLQSSQPHLVKLTPTSAHFCPSWFNPSMMAASMTHDPLDSHASLGVNLHVGSSLVSMVEVYIIQRFVQPDQCMDCNPPQYIKGTVGLLFPNHSTRGQPGVNQGSTRGQMLTAQSIAHDQKEQSHTIQFRGIPIA